MASRAPASSSSASSGTASSSTARSNRPLQRKSRATVHGRAGRGLEDASWAVNAGVAAAGRRGELRCAEILEDLPEGVAVLHDLRIPIPGFTANVDHMIVIGNRVWIIDAKAWRPGTYWTAFGRSYCGLKRVPHAEKKTMQMALKHFAAKVPEARWQKPVIAVFSSNVRKTVSVRWLKFPGSDSITEKQLERMIAKLSRRAKPADPQIVNALRRHLN